MTDRASNPRRPPLDPEPLSLGRRAMYRRVIALLNSEGREFVLGGAIGLSLQLGRLIDGELEIYMEAGDVPDTLAAIEAAGLKPEVHERHGKARVTYGDHRATIRWQLPTPLYGDIDRAWFDRARRTRFLGLRVRVAPAEELLWLRVAVPSAASIGDPLVAQLLLGRGEHLDWAQLLLRLVGLEALLLAHLFLFWHQYPESARTVIPPWVIKKLRDRLERATDQSERSLAGRSLHDAHVNVIEDSLAEQSLHGGG